MVKVKINIIYIFLALVNMNLIASDDDSLYFQFEPDLVSLEIGDSINIKVSLLSRDGSLSKNQFLLTGEWGSVEVKPWISNPDGVANVRLKVSVKTAYEGTRIKFFAKIFDQAGVLRNDIEPIFNSSNEKIASFDKFGNLSINQRGRVELTVSIKDQTYKNIFSRTDLRIIRNPVRKIELSMKEGSYRTGDVITFVAKAKTASGKEITDIPVEFSYTGKANYGIGLPASGLITPEGKFVAENPGEYTVYATSSGYTSSLTIKIKARNIQKRAQLIGHGLITDVFTSDLWVWQGVDEFSDRDFAITGTWEANGEAYFWEVTDPSNLVIIDTVTVDARTVNDVKISADGRIGVMTREGASSRKNGIVILDVSDPFNVKILSEFSDGLTGGVHNAFIYDNHVYAVNNGRKYDIINISDPTNPWKVNSYELNTPGHSIHDVWIENGIAYSSNWADGVVAVDIGGAKFDEADRSKSQFNPLLSRTGQGSPSNPVKLASMEDPTGRNHAAFPFLSKSTGNFYIIAGDENFPWGVLAPKGQPSNPRGGYHFLNFSDPDNPKEEAIYEVPEAGSHNLWVFDDILIAGNYQGGLRVVDISGELLGDIYKQGREIGLYVPYHKEGKIPNAPMVWGAQPYKDYIFFADMNSGLYCIQLVDGQPSARRIPG